MAVKSLSFIALAAQCALGATVQKPGLTVPSQYAGNLDTVKQMFVESYEAYRKYAWGHDDLSPISDSYTDGRNGWGASIADAMSTMVVMGLDDYLAEAVNYTYGVDFSRSYTNDTVSLFETTIRYVGGFISAYELSGFAYPILVEKAKEVADQMAYAWTDNHAMPYNYINFTDHAPVIDTTNIAQAGTLTMEWYLLSKYTGNNTYAELAEKSAKYITTLGTPLPGLAPQVIDPTTGQFADAYLTWGGGSDSYFEYLVKFPRLTNTDDSTWVSTWLTAVDSSIRYLYRTSTVGNWSYIADQDDDGNIVHIGSHLECFHGGNWMLGGKMVDNETIVNIGLELTDACFNTYRSTATGIGPEVFAYFSSDGNYTGETPSASDIAFYDEHGFFIYNGAYDYILRPEVLESNFYAWRVTGDTKYLDNAVEALNAFNEYLKVSSGGFAGTNDVNNKTATLIDDTESFWFAEVVKYLYLHFDDPSHISLDNYVFNTECHPFIAPPGKSSYAPSDPSAKLPAFKSISAPAPDISFNPFLPKQLKDIIHP